MAEQQCGLSKEEAEKFVREATAGKVASESVTEAHQEGRHFQTPRISWPSGRRPSQRRALFSAADGDFDSTKQVASDHLIDIATKKRLPTRRELSPKTRKRECECPWPRPAEKTLLSAAASRVAQLTGMDQKAVEEAAHNGLADMERVGKEQAVVNCGSEYRDETQVQKAVVAIARRRESTAPCGKRGAGLAHFNHNRTRHPNGQSRSGREFGSEHGQAPWWLRLEKASRNYGHSGGRHPGGHVASFPVKRKLSGSETSGTRFGHGRSCKTHRSFDGSAGRVFARGAEWNSTRSRTCPKLSLPALKPEPRKTLRKRTGISPEVVTSVFAPRKGSRLGTTGENSSG